MQLRLPGRTGRGVNVGLALSIAALVGAGSGCGPTYRDLRIQGQMAMAEQNYAPARVLLEQADEKNPRQLENLYDLATCSTMIARERAGEMNRPAAMRELDEAIAYYRRALEVQPGNQAVLEGLNSALELRGDREKALEQAEWAARFVGPMARQYLFLARELEERGQMDEALLRYRQAVTIEPRNAEAHRAFARFLLNTGNETAAIYHLQAAYRLDPRNEWVLDQLAARGRVPALTEASTTTTTR
ncbi:MAG: tetratricopeptide repeat protein [Phycisphaerae bacterium]|nr:tetratricopeptide repeat protein [Phycisphaerae bacterium]